MDVINHGITFSQPLQLILTDIEGTTTSLTFVKDVLFPYSTLHLPQFLKEQWGKGNDLVEASVLECKNTLREEDGRDTSQMTLEEVIATFLSWIKEDRKHPALKRLQGALWKDGYEKKEYVAHLYPDVLPCLEEWKRQGLALGVYSSGSVAAQHLLFQHTTYGDVRSLFSYFFDTQVGAKVEAASYHNISKLTGVAAEGILFLSDMEKELEAAREAGMQTVQLVREGEISKNAKHFQVSSFDQINFT